MYIVLTADKRPNTIQPACVIIPHPSLNITSRLAQLGNYYIPRTGGSELPRT